MDSKKETKTMIIFKEMLSKYKKNKVHYDKEKKIELEKEKEEFELAWIKAGLQIFRK